MKNMFPSVSTGWLFPSLGKWRHLALLVSLSLPIDLRAADAPKNFASPDQAVAALTAAANAEDFGALRTLFGSAAADLENPDRVQATNEFRTFATALSQGHKIVRDSDSRCLLEVGNNAWPFPVPIVQKSGQWHFDTDAGKDEILNRRIGRNELATLQVTRAYVEAQREYAFKDRDGDEVLEYAPKFRSSEGMKDGLHWSPDLDGEISPLGPLVAEANDDGYTPESKAAGSAPEPFHGYYFKILTEQAGTAPGGRYSYIINGNMIGGFALIAWPAEYGDSGIMTFIVNQQGRVYQKDLGADTGKIANKTTAYAPDPTWTVSRD